MKARKNKSRKQKLTATEILNEVIEGIIEQTKTAIKTEKKRAYGCFLIVADEAGMVGVFQLRPEDSKAQYETIRTLCSEHKAIAAVYVRPGMVNEVHYDSLKVDPEDPETKRILIDQMNQYADGLTPKVRVPATIEVQARDCMYFYGATKHEQRSIRLPYILPESDDSVVEVLERQESDCPVIVTSSGSTVSTHSWFDGVEWSDVDDVSLVNPILN